MTVGVIAASREQQVASFGFDEVPSQVQLVAVEDFLDRDEQFYRSR